MERTYNALLYKEKEEYGICFPDFLGCVSTGGSIQEALENGREALELHLEGMLEDKEDFLLYSDDEALLSYLNENKGGIISTVTVTIPEKKTKRLDITLPVFLAQRIDRKAQKEHETRSSFIAKCCMKHV